MIKIGQYNNLTVSRLVDFGAYLSDSQGQEILLPSKYIPELLILGQQMEVFVYTDSEDRPIATTLRPRTQVGEFALLTVKAVNKMGAFLDWGLEKDLLVPYSEQTYRMHRNGDYLVYVYLDNASNRVVASAKIDKFIGNLIPDYRVGDKVKAMVYKSTPIGLSCIVDNLHKGMIYQSEVYGDIPIGTVVDAKVGKVRQDGKIDLIYRNSARKRTDEVAQSILEYIRTNKYMSIGDKSSPEDISMMFGCSKRDFKQALGHLLKMGKISKEGDNWKLLDP